ncbi:MAG: copper chaperone PCu(A)C [Parvularculaceae bacterium]
MRKFFSFAAALALTLWSITAIAHEYEKDAILIAHPWARPSMAAHVPGAMYFDIVNKGEEGDRLLAVKTLRAEAAEIHKSTTSPEGLVSMELQKDGVAAPAKSTVSFETGAYHVMLIGLKGKLTAGESFPVTLVFEKAGEVEVTVKVEDRDARAAVPDHAEHRH